MRNLRLCIAYDGTDFLGWQQTQEGPSIEAALKTACERLLRHPVTLQAASRTDVGVHAAGQVVNFFTENTDWECHRLLRALNSTLPKTIVVRELEDAIESFHPTLHNTGKEYHYHVCAQATQLPQHRRLSWHMPEPLDRDLMQQAMSLLVGEHDFKAFCNQRKQLVYDTYVRQLRRFTLTSLPSGQLRFELEGSAFLYKMVRNLVGTVVDIGRGRLPLASLPAILDSRDRTRAGVTAPAHGLVLWQVFYAEGTKDVNDVKDLKDE